MTLLIEPHYIGSIEFFGLLLSYDNVCLEVSQHFSKQTFKNRCSFLGANGKLDLSVPVVFGNRTPYRDVKIDHQQGWRKVHRGALSSCYGKSPYYEFFAEDFYRCWDRCHHFLIDLNRDMMTICLKMLQVDRDFALTSAYTAEPEIGVLDLREEVLPKKRKRSRTFYTGSSYNQTFGSFFVPNLSIIDLLMNEGPGSLQIARDSVLKAEQ